jgi:DNA-binding protein HU-beta
MNRGQLIKAVAAHTRQDPKEVEAVLTGMTDVITAVVSKGEAVTVQGFAKFAKVERAARMGRNPRTGEQIRIKASKRVRVSAMKAFKDTVMSPSQAPRLERGVWPTSRELLTQQASERRESERAAAGGRTAKAAGTKRTVKKAAAKRTTGRKVAARKAPAKKATTARRPATRRPAAKKTTAKKAPARRTATTRRPAAKKTTARRATKRTARR